MIPSALCHLSLWASGVLKCFIRHNWKSCFMNLEIFSHDLDALILWHLYNLVNSRSGLSFAHLVIFSASSPLFLMAK